MSKYGDVDFWFTADGDLAVDDTGDIKDTSGVLGRAIVQEIRDRLRSRRGEWAQSSMIGSNFVEHIGEPINQQRISQITREVQRALTFDRMLLPTEIEIIPLQLGKSILIFRIVVHTREGSFDSQIGYNSDTQRFVGY